MVALPSRLLGYNDGNFFVFNPREHGVEHFDIISHRWGAPVDEYDCGIEGINWKVTISKEKLEDIKRLMITAKLKYLWVDCLCIDQENENEKATEISKMYQYYRSAENCHILISMPEAWNPQDIVTYLKYIDHILTHMGRATLASEARGLTKNLTDFLTKWENNDWAFAEGRSTVKSAAIDMGLLNCYATCIHRVGSLFRSLYFSRVWTFQEMILGNNIRMWGIDAKRISDIGELRIWMDLATDSRDKAYKLHKWIRDSWVLKTASAKKILGVIEEQNLSLSSLQTQVEGISSARTDIINGGPSWWYENHKGISNIFSAVSIMPRECDKKADMFRGLLGIFSGLFTPEEIERDMSGDDIERISFNFFKQLSTKTGRAWTRLAISSGVRGEWDWIPMIEDSSRLMTTDCFAGVINLGRLKRKGRVKATAMTGITGVPRKYMKIVLRRENMGFQFFFKGCNCGKRVKTGRFSKEPIPTYDQPRNVVKDETGRILVQCATILGSIIDPGTDVVEYRRRLLHKLQPNWEVNDPSAKPNEWVDRCVSGTFWENPDPQYLRTHNMSMNYRMVNLKCESRLENESTASISCEVRVNCGCTIVAPFSLIFEALTAVQGSSLGDTTAALDDDRRIILKDGLGLVQVGDVGRTFNLVAFGGDVNFHKARSCGCRGTKVNKAVVCQLPWPSGRALVREDFNHNMTNMMRDYGYVGTGGSGNLLIRKNHRMGRYKIIGVCIDEFIPHKVGSGRVTIR